MMFVDEIIIGSIRSQSDRLKSLVENMGHDQKCRNNGPYYAKELYEIEKCLRRIRREDIESVE